jgi:transposase
MAQARWQPDARAYLARKRTEGRTGAEARRCLKRHLAAVVYRAMLHDLAQPADPTPISAKPIAA